MALRSDFYDFKEKLSSRMSDGFRQLSSAVQGSQELLSRKFEELISGQDTVTQSYHALIVAGQQDLLENLDRMEQNFSETLNDHEVRLANNMKRLFSSHHAAVSAVVDSGFQQSDAATRFQTERLVRSPIVLSTFLLIEPDDSLERAAGTSPKTAGRWKTMRRADRTWTSCQVYFRILCSKRLYRVSCMNVSSHRLHCH
jgi:hypothetical protein